MEIRKKLGAKKAEKSYLNYSLFISEAASLFIFIKNPRVGQVNNE